MGTLAVWHKLGMVAERFLERACPEGLNLVDCVVLAALPKGDVQEMRVSQLVEETRYPERTLQLALKRMATAGYVVRAGSVYSLTEAGASIRAAYLQARRAIEEALSTFYSSSDERSAHRVARVFSMLEAKGLAPHIDHTQSPPKLVGNIFRTEFMLAHDRRGRRTCVNGVIAEDELGPILRLSDQVLEGTSMAVGTPVRVYSEFEIITVNLRDAKK
jgi:Mn-dependent DtxR family transcriptional regulator